MPSHKNNLACFGIDLRGLTVRFRADEPVLDGVDLRVAAGEIVALVGASGCGKTTLLRTLAGLQSFELGSLNLISNSDSNPQAAKTLLARESAFVFQQPTLLPWRNVSQNICLPMQLGERGRRGEGHRLSQRGMSEVLASVGLTQADATKYPNELSGGMQMRVSLARALVTDPSILLLDEPFAALDDLLRARMNELLLQMHARRTRTVVLVTHNIAEAVFLSQRIAVMGRGTIYRELENTLPPSRGESLRGSLEFAQMFSLVSQALHEAGA